MNFFEAQDSARRNTWRLAALFVAAVTALIVMTNLLVAAVYAWTSNYAMPGSAGIVDLLAGLPGQYWLFISTGVLGVVGVASLYKYMVLRGGGRTIAEALGGSLISRNTTDPLQQRTLNVVEEMAIASGIAVPPVYLINQPSINAFAAGFTPDDAVIGVNQGTIELLNRDELQGVIGHEFSHILNGDTRINLRLIAILHGILFIGMIGYGILRGVGMGARSRRSNSSSGGLPVLALALGLLIIGYAGTFFGNLIKAAVSRQREFLADAAAVQFTRNPDGIAGALKKIGGLSVGSSMPGGAAAEASHLLFGPPRSLFLNRLLSTHPPLQHRIRAIDPGWNGEFPRLAADAAEVAHASPASASLTGHATAADSIAVALTAESIVDQVGVLDQRGLDCAQALIATTQSRLREAAHDPYSGRAMLHAMLLSHDEQPRQQQLQQLAAHAEPAVREQVLDMHAHTRQLDEAHKLTLVEMTIPTLKELSRPQYQRFMNNIVELIKADSQVDLFEWVLHRLLMKELTPHFDGPRRVSQRYAEVADAGDAAPVLLSALAREDKTGDPQQAFAAGLEILEIGGSYDAAADPNFARLNQALRKLRQLKPLAKPRLIKACARVAMAGDELSVRQGALLQGIAAALDCPLPPSIYATASLR